MSTYLENLLQKNLFIETGKVVGISAPTGSGKTTGAWSTINRTPSFFGSTLFVFPTFLAAQSVSSREKSTFIFACTPRQAIRTLTEKNFPYKTVVVDEAHYMSKEYIAILKILETVRTMHDIRLIFLSATLDEDRLLGQFTGMKVVYASIESAPFPIEIHYQEQGEGGGVHIYQRRILDNAAKTISDLVLEDADNKILVFMASHDQCEILFTMIKKIKTIPVDYYVCTLHGGKTPEDISEVKQSIIDSRRMICICTNIAETAITLPGVNVVVDSGIRCVAIGSVIVQKYCDKASMVQRAGRTGRTCPGRVYRLMTQSSFDKQSFQEIPTFCFDSVVLQFFSLRRNPVFFLGDLAMDSIIRFQELGIMKDVRTPPDIRLVSFLDKCGVDTEYGLILYRFVQSMHFSGKPDKFNLLMMTSIVILNLYNSRPVHLLFIPPGSPYKTVVSIRQKIEQTFSHDHDLLMTILRIFIGLFMSKDPREYAQAYSLNFKTFRDIRKDVFRLGKFVYNKNFSLQEVMETDWIEESMAEKIRMTFLRFGDFDRVPTISRMLGLEESHIYVDDRSVVRIDTYHRLYNQPHYFIPLIMTQTNYIPLWINPPADYRTDTDGLACSVSHARHCMDDKIVWKDMFSGCIQEINDEVAYRPGKFKMEISMEHFHNLVNQL